MSKINKIQKIIILILVLAATIAGIRFADENTTWSLLSFILAIMSLGIVELVNIKSVLEKGGGK